MPSNSAGLGVPGVQHCLIPVNCKWILTFLDWVSRCSLIAFVTVDLPLHGIPVITISGIFWAKILSNWFQREKVTIPTNNLFSGKMKNQIGKQLGCFFFPIYVPFYKIILINITNKNKTMTNPMVNSKIITVVLFLVMWKRAVLLNLPWKLYSLIFCYQWPWPWNLPILLVLTKGRVKGSQLVGCS